MIALVATFALLVPPQSTLPPLQAPACQCGPECHCKAPAAVQKTSRWQDVAGNWYETREDGRHYAVAPTVSNSTQVSTIRNSGCQMINGQMVCPTKR
jgi:hypothetical protein